MVVKTKENPPTLKNNSATPFVKWAGGKGQLFSQFRQVFPKRFRRYYEPFLGGGAVFLALHPKKARLSDLNEELINCWRVVRDSPHDLMESLERHKYEKDHFYQVRSMDPGGLSEAERAARFIYLNKSCYNGLYRVNRKGQFNVPFGRYSRPPNFYNRENIFAISQYLSGVKLDCCPFDKAVAGAKSGDFIYFDPPYQPLSKTSNFTGYTEGSFGSEDQERLSETTRKLHRRDCLVAISNSDTREIRRLYKGFQIEEILATRTINSNANDRGKITELLIRNF